MRSVVPTGSLSCSTRTCDRGVPKNLVCLDLSGKRLWEAEFPEPGKPDYYYEIGSRQPLVAYSLSSYDVELDPETGAILSKEFTK